MGSASEDRKRPLEENNWERNCWKPWGEQAGATPFLSSLSLSAAKVLFLESCVPCCLINVFNCCRSALKTLSWSKTVILKQVELHFFSMSRFQAVLGKAVSHQFRIRCGSYTDYGGMNWGGWGKSSVFHYCIRCDAASSHVFTAC